MNKHDKINYYMPVAKHFIKLGLIRGSYYDADGICCSCYDQLDDILGVSWHHDFMKRALEDDFPMNEQQRRLCKMLIGPHTHAVLKMWRLQNGLD